MKVDQNNVDRYIENIAIYICFFLYFLFNCKYIYQYLSITLSIDIDIHLIYLKDIDINMRIHGMHSNEEGCFYLSFSIYWSSSYTTETHANAYTRSRFLTALFRQPIGQEGLLATIIQPTTTIKF